MNHIRIPGRLGCPGPDRTGFWSTGLPPRSTRPVAERGIAATIPELDDQIGHPSQEARPIDLGEIQRERHWGRNVVERCFNRITQWRCRRQELQTGHQLPRLHLPDRNTRPAPHRVSPPSLVAGGIQPPEDEHACN